MIEALHPFNIYVKGDSAAQELAHAFGIPYVVATESFGASITAAHQLGIPAILPESGGQGMWEEHHITPLVEGCNALCKRWQS